METVFNQSIWGDEGFSAILSMKSLPEIIKIIATDTSPPLWNITEWLLFNTLGTAEIYIRGLAFLYFSLTIFFTYKIGKLLWDKKTGLIAAALTFLNPFFFIYAFEGRMYSILALGVTASMYFFLKIMRSKNVEKRDMAGYVIATLWAMYSHHFAMFALMVQGLWFIREYIFGKRKRAMGMLKAFVFVGIGYLPWVVPLYKQVTMVGGGFWLGTPTLKDFFELLGKYLGAGIKHKFQEIALTLTLIILVFRNWLKKPKEDLFLLSWFVGPIALTWFISQVFQSIFFDRYLLYTIPGAMLLVASKRKRLSEIIIAALVLVCIIINYHYFTHPTKLPFREMANYVKQTRQEGDFLINWNSSAHHIWETKYYGIPAPIYIPGGGELPYFVGTALMEKDDVISELPANIKRVGVVTTGPIEEIELPGYTKGKAKQLDNLKFIWYVKSD